eukprot:1580353-Rhodomonas_salina.1
MRTVTSVCVCITICVAPYASSVPQPALHHTLARGAAPLQAAPPGLTAPGTSLPESVQKDCVAAYSSSVQGLEPRAQGVGCRLKGVGTQAEGRRPRVQGVVPRSYFLGPRSYFLGPRSYSQGVGPRS